MRRLIVGVVLALALTFFAGVGIGSRTVGPTDIAPPTPTKTITKAVPGPAVTVTPKPVIRVRDKVPQNCLDALTSSDRLLDLFQQYRDAAAKAQEAILGDQADELVKATANLNTIASRINPNVENYRIDSGGCRNLAK